MTAVIKKSDIVRKNIEAIIEARRVGSTWASIARALSTPEIPIGTQQIQVYFAYITATGEKREAILRKKRQFNRLRKERNRLEKPKVSPEITITLDKTKLCGRKPPMKREGTQTDLVLKNLDAVVASRRAGVTIRAIAESLSTPELPIHERMVCKVLHAQAAAAGVSLQEYIGKK